jgi:putative phosphoribosyl transferase
MRYFHDRNDAGNQLAEVLRGRRLERPIVLGIPRGGVPVAARVAEALDAELGVVVARKLRAPGQPELAIGAVTADGVTWLNEELVAATGASPAHLERESAAQKAEAAQRQARFAGTRARHLKGRTVVIVDDGVATGATALAAARSVRAAGAARTVVAVPVGPPETVAELGREADEVICLREEPDFYAVGQFYADFHAVQDSDVDAILRAFRAVETREARVRRDGIELAVRLRLPRGRPPVVIFVHGLGSSKDSPRNVTIGEQLVDEDIATVLFDLSGHGDSTPNPRADIDDFVADLAAVEAWVCAQPGVDSSRLALAGSSLGAVVALQAALTRSTRAAAVVLRAPPADPAMFAGLRIPALLLVGSHDGLLREAEAAARVSGQVELKVVRGASHLFEEPGTLEEAASITVSWLSNRLFAAEPASPAGARAR